MLHVGDAGCLDAKIIDDKAEGSLLHVTPKSRHVLTLIVTSEGKVFSEEFVCEDAGLWEPIHTLQNFDIYPSIGINSFVEIVFVDDFVRKDIQP
jgi:hypothetical protein